MKNNDQSISILSDLLQINHDRVEGYKKLGYNSDVYELKSLFSNMADESRKNITNIKKEIMRRFEEISLTDSTLGGEVYGAWHKVTNKYTGSSSASILNSCEIGEIAILHAYKVALDLAPESIHELIETQEQSLNTSYEVIKAYRQAYNKSSKVYS